jgi:ABC-2 type transport system ATP-binding protein
VKVATEAELVPAAAALGAFAATPATVDEALLLVTAPIGQDVRLIDIVRALDAAGVDALDVDRRQSTLDDVFLTLTDPASPDATPEEVPA